MFIQALEQISLKISKSNLKEQGYKILERKIMESPVLKGQLEIYTILKENAGKLIKSKDYSEFYDILKEKIVTFKVEDVENEVKALLEYFNINPSNVKMTVMDSAMRLNEVSIKDIVMNTKKKQLMETFKRLIKKPEEESIKTQFDIIKYYAKGIRDKQKKEFVKESIASLLAERYKDYTSTLKKLYNLRRVTENIIESYSKKEVKPAKKLNERGAEAVAKPNIEKEISDFYADEKEKASQYGPGTASRMGQFKDLPYLKGIYFKVPQMRKRPEQLEVHFEVPVYPFGVTRTSNTTILASVEKLFQRLERSFINNTIYKGGKEDYFDMVGNVWEANLKRAKLQPGQFTSLKVTAYLNTNEKNRDVNSAEVLYKNAYQMLQIFNEALPELMGRYASVLTPEAEKAAIKKIKSMTPQERQALARQDGDVNVELNKQRAGMNADETERNDDFGGAF